MFNTREVWLRGEHAATACMTRPTSLLQALHTPPPVITYKKHAHLHCRQVASMQAHWACGRAPLPAGALGTRPARRAPHPQHFAQEPAPCTDMDMENRLLTGGQHLARPRSQARCGPLRAHASGPCAPAPPRLRAPCRRASYRQVVPRRPCVWPPAAPRAHCSAAAGAAAGRQDQQHPPEQPTRGARRRCPAPRRAWSPMERRRGTTGQYS